MPNITLQKTSITDIHADCIVNAANTGLLEGDGVCGAIFQAAGARELQKACDTLGGCKTGSAVITPAFKLSARYIIHAVGPRWSGGTHGEAELLYGCYRASLNLARGNACHSIAFPLISAGIFGYPQDQAWEVAVHAISDWQRDNPIYELAVVFTVPNDGIRALGEAVLSKVGSNKPANQFVFFWHEYEENGCFSQWYPSSFTIEGIQYLHCEQYMMAKKALLFHDYEYYRRIIAELDPKKCKFYGSKVDPFDPAVWAACAEEIVYHANCAKFNQHEDLKAALLATGDKTLAEASPYDPIWGIGLSAADLDSLDPTKWKGANLLGKVLMQVRDSLKNGVDMP